MMVRRNRPTALGSTERLTFLLSATAFHKELGRLSNQIMFSCPDARAVSKLSRAVCDAIEAISGEPVPWAQVRPSSHGPLGIDPLKSETK